MRKFTFNPQPAISIERLIEICKAMESMDRKQSFAFGKECGISKHNVDSIRQMLGYSDSNTYSHKTAEERDLIADEYMDGGVSICELARRHGLAYNSVRCILLNRNVTITTSKNWTRRQEMYLLNEYKKGRPTRLIAESIGKSQKSIQQKIKRMKRDGIIKELK